jgi:hypothetical protein
MLVYIEVRGECMSLGNIYIYIYKILIFYFLFFIIIYQNIKK